MINKQNILKMLGVTGLTFLAFCICHVALAQDDCKIPKEPKYKDLISKQKKKFPAEEVEKLLSEYPEIKEAVNKEMDTESDDKDPQAGNDIEDSDWKIHCPFKMKNAQHFGVKDGKKMCWVLTPLWISQCSKATCEYTFVSQTYYQCRPRYMPVQFFAYCPSSSDGPFKLLLRYVPKYCDCRRYFCGEEANPFPVEPERPPASG